MNTKTKIIIGASAAVVVITTVIILVKRKRWYQFGWVGGQNYMNKNMMGLHLPNDNANKFNVGDTVEIKVTTGDTSYNGYHTVALIGADDGSYKDSMITIDTPKNGTGAQGQASGKVRKV